MKKKKIPPLSRDGFLGAIYQWLTIVFVVSMLIFLIEKYIFQHALLYFLDDRLDDNAEVFGRVIAFPSAFFYHLYLVSFVQSKLNNKSFKENFASIRCIGISLFIFITSYTQIFLQNSFLEKVSAVIGTVINYIIVPVIVILFLLDARILCVDNWEKILIEYVRFWLRQWKKILFILALIVVVILPAMSLLLMIPFDVSDITNTDKTIEQRVDVLFFAGLAIYLALSLTFVLPWLLSKLLYDFVVVLQELKREDALHGKEGGLKHGLSINE